MITANDLPILILVYNRPECTKRVFDSIRRFKPARLFVSADGASNSQDIPLCQTARDITEQIDWPCEVKRNYREHNLGCRNAVYGGLQWFFEQVEEGIVLEDDTLPSDQFFYFCAALLAKYRDNPQVMMIAGSSYYFERISSPFDYHFSAFASVWGWATWKRAWEYMNIESRAVSDSVLEHRIQHPTFRQYFSGMLQSAFDGKLNTWDVQWAYSILEQHGLVARPFHNLIQNIGYRGAHAQVESKKSIFFDMPIGEINSEMLNHPPSVELSYEYDNITFDSITSGHANERGLKDRLARFFSSNSD